MMNRILITLLTSLLIAGFPLSAQVADGIGSFYGDGFHGRSTSTGETFNKNAMTAACKVFPNGSILKVTNKANGRFVQVKVNDCGPHVAGRIIDLSSGAAQVIGLRLGEVRVEVITLGTDGPTCNRGNWIRAGRPPFRVDLSAFPVTGTPPSPVSPTTAPSAPAPNVGSGSVRPNTTYQPPTAPTAPSRATPAAPTAPTTMTPRTTRMRPPVAPTTATVRLSPPTAPTTPTINTAPSTEALPESAPAPTTYSPPIRIEQPQEIEAAPAPTPPSPAPAQTSEVAAQYAVQIAAYREQSNANSMIEQLRAAGFEGAVAIRGGNIIRVFSKPVNFREQADYWKEKLAEAGFNGSIRRIR